MTTDRLVKRMTAGALLSGSLAFAAFSLAAGTAQAFNPQPEPPTRRLPGVAIAGI